MFCDIRLKLRRVRACLTIVLASTATLGMPNQALAAYDFLSSAPRLKHCRQRPSVIGKRRPGLAMPWLRTSWVLRTNAVWA